MSISPQTRALLLLTIDLGGEPPLDGAAYERLAGWLRRRGMQPADLLCDQDAAARLAGRPAGTAETARIVALLGRGPLLAAALEGWQAASLWVVGRGDPDYPRRLKRRLRAAAPAVLFGCGDRALLNRGGVALLGGDDDAAEPAAYAAAFGTAAAASGLTTISGGSSVIEAAAIRAGLSRGGGAVAVLPDRLAGEARSDRLRRPATDGLLVFVSATLPDHEAATPSQRAATDDCLYGLADAALLVGVGRTGTRWAGAVVASERGWVPLWARRADPDAAELARIGAGLLSGDPVSPRTLLDPPAAAGRTLVRPPQPPGAVPMAFMTPPPGPTLAGSGLVGAGMAGFAEAPAAFGVTAEAAPSPSSIPPPAPTLAPSTSAKRGGHLRLVASATRARPGAAPAGRATAAEPGLYDIFVSRVLALLAAESLGAWHIANLLGLTEHQAEAWLGRAEAAGQVRIDPVTRLYRCGGDP